MINGCPECLKRQREIDSLKEENQRLKQKLRYQERKAQEGFFGSSTSSSKIPLKPDRPEKQGGKPKGARPGHLGKGRPGPDLVQGEHLSTVVSSIGDLCPQCGSPTVNKGYTERLVMESRPLRAEPLIYWLPKRYCPKCRRVFQPCAPGVLPKSLYGNQLMANATVMHYLHGIPLGRVCEQLQANPGSLIEGFHRIAIFFTPVLPKLIELYRQSVVKHADETGWRTAGQNGYVWLFTTDSISLFLFRQTRSGKVPPSHLRKSPFAGRPRRGSLRRIQPSPLPASILLCPFAQRGPGPRKGLPRFRGSQNLCECHGPPIGHGNGSPTPTHQRGRVSSEGCRNQSPDRRCGRRSRPPPRNPTRSRSLPG